MRLLLVEDDAKLARALVRGLEREGYAIDVAHTGPDALKHAFEHRYDGIVLDVMLPGMDGFSVCAELRRNERRLPVLMLTARGDVSDRIRGLDAGADDYLVKPFGTRAKVGLGGRRPQAGEELAEVDPAVGGFGRSRG